MADIKKKPTMKVTGLGAPTRGTGSNNYQLTVKWSIPSSATKSSNEARIQGLEVEWDFDCYNINSGKTKTLNYVRTTGNTSQTSWTLYLNEFKCSDGKTYDRNSTSNGHVSFYPVDTYWCIRTITVKVRGYNSKGKGPWVTTTRDFLKPNQPKITKLEQGAGDGIITLTVEHDKGTDFREIHSTKIFAKVVDQTGKEIAGTGTEATLTNSETSKTITIEDIYSRMQQSYDDWVRIDVWTYARGLWGRSDEMKSDKTVRQFLYVSWPQQPEIKRVTVSNRNDITSKITFDIETGYHPQREAETGEHNPHPTTGVKLQALADVTYEKATDIPASEEDNWKDCGALDNGNCSALSSTVAELQPSAGKYTWVRVKSWNQVESIFYRYSKPRRMTELEREAPTAADDSAIIYSAVSGDDGKSAVVSLAWNDDDSTGTEVAWSTSPNAWRSNDEPDTYRITWSDGPVTVGQTPYDQSATVHIAGLEEGTEYHLRSRRYLIDADGEESHGPWYPENTTVTVTPATAPKSVTLSTAGYVRRGEPIQVAWTFDSESEQKSWQLITGDTYTTNETVKRGSSTAVMTHTWIREEQYASGGQTVNPTVIILASGEDPTGSCVLAWDEHLEEVVGSDDEIPLAVRVSTGGAYVTSEAVTVAIADPPTLSMAVATLTAQPLSLSLTSNVPAEVAIVVSANYVTGGYASGEITQTTGDTAWSTVITPDWSYSSGSHLYTATVTAPTGLQLMDGATYDVAAVATDTLTGLSSEQADATFAVNYSRKAPEPSDSITVTPHDVTDEGIRSRYAVIALAEPTSGISSDVYDVYRITPDGPYLIAEGVLTTETVTDPWAPYGNSELAYRVATRTVDGCEEFADFPYELPGRELRVDFGGDYVELPYNLKVSDGYGKDFEARRHLDGSIDGYWNRGVERTASLSTDVIKLTEEGRVNAVRRLARHAGPCFVRLPDGSAYQANVQVGSIGREYGSFAIGVTIDATEVGLTDYVGTIPPGSDG